MNRPTFPYFRLADDVMFSHMAMHACDANRAYGEASVSVTVLLLRSRQDAENSDDR